MTITKVACGQDFTMALTDKGRIVGWGNNRNGQIGHPASDIIHRPRCVCVCMLMKNGKNLEKINQCAN